MKTAPDTLTLRRPDDWHIHFRDGAHLAAVLPHTARQFGRALAMPNLKPPMTTTAALQAYRSRILAAVPAGLTFDAICAFQVLEHLPFDEFETCLAGIARRANPHVFISLPYRGLRIRWAFWWGDHHFTIGHKFMLPWRHKPIPEHHWEMGYPYTARKITKVIGKHMDVVTKGFIRENPYHYMWQLRRRGELTSG